MNEYLQGENGEDPEGTQQKNCLVVTHGGFIMEFINCYKSYIDPDYKEVMNFDVRNTCVNKFQITKEIINDEAKTKYEIEYLNDFAHLKEDY